MIIYKTAKKVKKEMLQGQFLALSLSRMILILQTMQTDDTRYVTADDADGVIASLMTASYA